MLDVSGVDGEGDVRDVEYEWYVLMYGMIVGGLYLDLVVEMGTLVKVASSKSTYEYGIWDLCDSGGLSVL